MTRSVPLYALKGLTAFFLGAAAGSWLLGYSHVWRPRFLWFIVPPDASTPVLALTLTGVAVAVAPLLAAPLRHRGGWAVATVGVGAAALLSLVTPTRTPIGLSGMALLVAAALGLGGAVVAMTTARPAARAWIAAGLGGGLLLGSNVVALFAATAPSRQFELFWHERWGLWWVAGIALLGALACLVAARPGADSAVGTTAAPARPPARILTLVLPVVVVTALAVATLAADTVRGSTLATFWLLVLDAEGRPERLNSLYVVDGAVRVAIVIVVGAALSWYAYTQGRAAAGRWVWTGIGLSLPLLMWVQFVADRSPAFPVPPPPASAVVATALAAVVAGVMLDRYAGARIPWDLLGLVVAAGGLGLWALWATRGFESDAVLHPYLLGIGAGLTLGAGLHRVATRSAPDRTPAGRAADATLGIAAMLLPSANMAWLLVNQNLFDLPRDVPGLNLHAPIAVLLAAAGVGLFYWLDRRAERLRPEPPAEDSVPATVSP